jgi:3-hydroxyacyl-[acyl-carrier-protein] dehydratase
VSSRCALEIAPDHPAFAGHFPGMPILPGALLLDEALRIIGLELALDLTRWEVVIAKFPETVRPGEALTLEHASPTHGLIRFAVRVADRLVLKGTLSMAPPGGAHGV